MLATFHGTEKFISQPTLPCPIETRHYSYPVNSPSFVGFCLMRMNYLMLIYLRVRTQHPAQYKNRNPNSVERYRFWLNHLLPCGMQAPLERAHRIKMPFLAYVKDLGIAQESQKRFWRQPAPFFAGRSCITGSNSCTCRPTGWKILLLPGLKSRASINWYA